MAQRTPPARSFQELILRLQNFWSDHGCLLAQPFDVQKGAGTYNPHTFLRVLGPEPWKVAYVEPSRRPTDGRYGDNPNRLYRHHQFQVILKPSPPDMQGLYLDSMRAIGIHPEDHDIRFVEDNWESPTLGAWGLGWEVWVDGMELTQFTYFQQCGGLECRPVAAELTYGLERIAMYLQNVDNVFDVVYAPGLTYREVFQRDEYEYSKFTFEELDAAMYQAKYEACEKECARLVEKKLVIPAYDHLLEAAHAFNSLDARGAIGVTERQGYILRIRDLAKTCAEGYLALRESLGFPLSRETTTDMTAVGAPEELDAEPRGKPHSAELFVEIGCEEIPAKEVMQAAESLRQSLVKGIEGIGLSHGEPRIFATPRRLAVSIPNIPDRQPDRTTETSGPPVTSAFADGKPTQAAIKFAEKLGLTVEQLGRKETKKGTYLVAVVSEKGKATAGLLGEIVAGGIAQIPFDRAMRWGSEAATFSRPIQWIVALFDDRRIPVTYAGVKSDRISRGHRFLAPHPFRVENADQYEEALVARKVIVDPMKRRDAILAGAKRLAEKAGGRLREDGGLIDEITQLVENPVPLLNHFDRRFLEIPDEVLISEMQHHQRYLPIIGPDGRLLPSFVVVANTNVENEQVSLDGYRRVLTARFEDGAFFFREDQKRSLASRIDDLGTIRFHRDLGSVKEKAARVVDLAFDLAITLRLTDRRPPFPSESKAGSSWTFPCNLERAGWLAKADLTTRMVFEFPELQGVMGAYYARLGGEPAEVAAAIREHYLPKGADDALPKGDLGALIGVADRLDSIAGIFSVGKGPTGSADPFGLRRASLGIIAILRSRGWHLSVEALTREAIAGLGSKRKKDEREVLAEIADFFRARLKGVATQEGAPTDVAEAVLAAGHDDVIDVLARAGALAELRKRPEFEPIAVTFKRVGKILEQAAEKGVSPGAVDGALLREDVEKKLFAATAAVAAQVETAIASRDFATAFRAIADIRPDVDAFFAGVMVMDEDPAVRARRISLVDRVHRIFSPLADLTKLS
jgi:glycyl-tRNA synthetase